MLAKKKKSIKRPSAEVAVVPTASEPAEVVEKKTVTKDGHLPTRRVFEDAHQTVSNCPYCESTDFVKRGVPSRCRDCPDVYNIHTFAQRKLVNHG